jgi:hypothetical protein
MAFGYTQDVPIDEAVYAKVRELLPEKPDGLLVHLVLKREGGLRYVDVWEDEAVWETFRLDHLEPALAKVLPEAGIDRNVAPPRFEAHEVIEVTTG